VADEHVALSLVNTVAWRLDEGRRTDRPTTPQALARWLEDNRLAGRTVLARIAAERWPLDDVLAFREVLYRVLRQVATGHPVDGQDLTRLRDGIADAMTAAELVTLFPPRWTVPVRGPGDLPRLLALQALDLLQTAAASRLRQCADGACGWLFLDRSRNLSRRWCSSADCGNRERARRHHRRELARARP
jgi:predicted RNA-binding Zn ribbon-like protein